MSMRDADRLALRQMGVKDADSLINSEEQKLLNPHPTLRRLMREGFVIVKDGEYLGRSAVDDQWVVVGTVGTEADTESYLKSTPERRW